MRRPPLIQIRTIGRERIKKWQCFVPAHWGNFKENTTYMNIFLDWIDAPFSWNVKFIMIISQEIYLIFVQNISADSFGLSALTLVM